MKPTLVAFGPVHPDRILRYVSGQRDTKCSLDTLKKEYDRLSRASQGKNPGFWQVLPTRVLGGPDHLSWAVLGVLSNAASDSLHFRQPELELVGRIAGTFQWAEAKARAGLMDSDHDVVLLWVGPRGSVSAAQFSAIATKWGLKPGKPLPVAREHGRSIESRFIEASALAGVE